ncbi:MAG: TonB-dependent receptor plug domain-containing protein [Rhodospirillaceae bacterium]
MAYRTFHMRARRGHLAKQLLSMTALSGMVAAGAVTILAGPAFAQAPPAQQASSEKVEEIVVTGSRVITNGFEAPTPVSVVASEAIEAAARPDLADFVNTLPAVNGSFTTQSQTQNLSNGRGGINAISLHGLGVSRTLVLLNGHRSVESTADGYVDVSAFPQGLVSRVDVVTGGASAAYGSDAVGGVVNFILDTKYEGIKGEVSGGVSARGDDRNWKIDLTGGHAFGGGRGHFLWSIEAQHGDGIPDYAKARDWSSYGQTAIANPAYGTGAGQSTSVPRFLHVHNGGPDQVLPGGIITSGPLKGIIFGPGGTPRNFNYGSITAGIVTAGGDWATQKQYQNATIDPPLTRRNAYARLSYDVSDDVTVFGEASWADNFEANGIAGEFYAGNLVLSASNPFLPASVAAQAAALKVTQFNMGTFLVDAYGAANPSAYNYGVPGLAGLQRRITNRYTFGANGKFDAMDTNWDWDAFFQYGKTRSAERSINNVNVANFTRALDAVQGPNGSIVCRSTLTNPTNGCVPYNIFGIGVASTAALNYVLGTSFRGQAMSQHAAGLTFNSKPFETWAGPVGFATGIEWRDQAVRGITDPVSKVVGWFNSSYQPTIGKYNVKEAFAEFLVPLARDTAWAQSFDVDVAGRVTDYSNSGTVETWKIGPTWTPIDDLRFRGGISRDVRAPNLGELYSGGSNSASAGAGLLDPFATGSLPGSPATGSQNLNGVGNPLLKPETAISKGLGVVVQPRFWPGFSASVDYWNVKMSNAIGTLNAQDILNQCFLGKTQLCSGVTRPPVSPVLTVAVANYNIAQSYYRGIDFEAGYTLHLDDVSEGMGGTLGTRFLGSLFLTDRTDNGITPVIELVGGNLVRKFKWSNTVTYSNDPITLVVQFRGFSAGVTNTTWIQCTSGCPASTSAHPTIDNAALRGDFDIDTTFTYKIDEHASAFFSVQNLLDKDPPAQMTGVTGSDTILGLQPTIPKGIYGVVGRNFRVGVRFKM